MEKPFKADVEALGAALLLGLTFLLVAGIARPALAEGPTDEQVLVDQAQLTFQDFKAAPEMGWFRDALINAKGMMIVPNLVKGGLLVGGSGGKGVFLARDATTGAWRGPAFYNMGSVTVGLQIGAEAMEVVILAMSDDAVKAMMSRQFKLGADLSVAAGPVGIGSSGGTSMPTEPFVSFARAKGLFAGLNIEGAVVTVDRDANHAYYGNDATPEGLLMGGEAGEKASGLRESLQ